MPLEKEFKYKLELLEGANNSGEVNLVKQLLQEKFGKDVSGSLESLNLAEAISQHLLFDKSAMDDILDIAPNALANPIILDSLIAYLQLQGRSESEIISDLGAVGITVTTAHIPGGEEKEGEIVIEDPSFYIDFPGIISFLGGEDNESESENKKDGEESFWDFGFLSENFDNICSELGNMIKGDDEKVVGITKDADGANIGITLHGILDKYMSNLISDVVSFGKEPVKSVKEDLRSQAKQLNLDGTKVVKVNNDGSKVTANDEHDNNIMDAIRNGDKDLVSQINIANTRNKVVDNSKTVEFTKRSNVMAEAAEAGRLQQLAREITRELDEKERDALKNNPIIKDNSKKGQHDNLEQSAANKGNWVERYNNSKEQGDRGDSGR